jgi:hypothetical protein
MIYRLQVGISVLLVTLLVSLSAISRSQSKSAQAPFSYDQQAPLDFREAGVETLSDATVHDVSYASPKVEEFRRTWLFQKRADHSRPSSLFIGARVTVRSFFPRLCYTRRRE